MKSKWLITLAVLAGISLNTMAGTITWGSSDLGVGYTDGWLIALYEDVSKDGWDATTINFTTGATDSDDIYLGVTTILSSGKGGVTWGTTFSAPGGSLGLGDYVYSVLFNAATIASAYNYKYTTMTDGLFAGGGNSWYTLPASDGDATYKTTTLSDWQAVPEPATALLFGIGGMGAWMVRRSKLKSKEEADA
jgi:hypothetical protein